MNDRESAVLRDTNDIVSSQGVLNASFSAVRSVGAPLWPRDVATPVASLFTDGTATVRNVEPRNTPTIINSVFNHRNFWDGRARTEFNGGNPLGSLEPTKVVKVTPHGKPMFGQVTISKSSAASQAAGPPLNGLEMSFDGRLFAHLGKKMLGARPLAQQTVAADDSVLGGVTLDTYAAFIRTAIDPTWWNAAPGWVVDLSGPTPALVLLAPSAVRNANQFTVMEYNFGLFTGLAIQEYEKLLVANDTPFDRFMEGSNDALTSQQRQGLEVFLGPGKCINCHGGAELTNASIKNVSGHQIIERMITGNNHVAVYDNGFYNIGVRRTAEDLGVGATVGPDNKPLSNTRFYQSCVRNKLAAEPTLSLADANSRCDVPRILARPDEALHLLTDAASLVDNPPAVADLLARATTLLSASPPDVVRASCLLATNLVLGCVDPGALDLLRALPSTEALALLLSEAASVLPDQTNPGSSEALLAPPLQPHERVAVDGAFKTPGLRNVALTAPYFHNGGTATLRQVVDFYNRGADFARENRNDLDPDIRPLGLSEQEKEALVAFLTALTDPRVAYDGRPFDHPSLDVSNGGTAATAVPFDFGIGWASVADDRVMLPAVGAAGCQAPFSPACGDEGLGSSGTSGTPFANFLHPLRP